MGDARRIAFETNSESGKGVVTSKMSHFGAFTKSVNFFQRIVGTVEVDQIGQLIQIQLVDAVGTNIQPNQSFRQFGNLYQTITADINMSQTLESVQVG